MSAKPISGPYLTKEGQIYQASTGKTLAIMVYFDETNTEQVATAKLLAGSAQLLDAAESVLQTLEQMVEDEAVRSMKGLLYDVIRETRS